MDNQIEEWVLLGPDEDGEYCVRHKCGDSLFYSKSCSVYHSIVPIPQHLLLQRDLLNGKKF